MIDLYDVGDGRHVAAPGHARKMPRPRRPAARSRSSTSTPRSTSSNASSPWSRRAEPRPRRRIRNRHMPSYTAPVARHALRARGGARHRALFEPARLRECDARPDRGDPDRGRPLRRRGAAPAQPDRRRGGLHPPRGRLGHHAARASRRPTTSSSPAAGRRCRRPRNMAGRACRSVHRHRGHRISALRQPGVRNV